MYKLFLGASFGGYAAWPFVDLFNRADSTNLGGDWLESVGSWEIVSNELKNVTAADADAAAFALHVPTADVRVYATLRASSISVVGIYARVFGSDYILCVHDAGAIAIYEVVGGTPTALNSGSASYAQGDTMELQCDGTAVTMYKGNSIVLTATTSVTQAGFSGIYASTTNQLFDNFNSRAPGSIWTYAPSGGIVVAGAAPNAKIRAMVGSGGISTGGAAAAAKVKAAVGSGGILLGGVAPVAKTRVYQPAGGYTLAGDAPHSITRAWPPSGGINMAGEAAYLFEPAPPSGGDRTNSLTTLRAS